MAKDISNIPVSQLREAAAAWRRASMPRGWFGGSGANMSTFDRIDEMITEIERLRNGPFRIDIRNETPDT